MHISVILASSMRLGTCTYVEMRRLEQLTCTKIVLVGLRPRRPYGGWMEDCERFCFCFAAGGCTE